jgi:hypothetical protein
LVLATILPLQAQAQRKTVNIHKIRRYLKQIQSFNCDIDDNILVTLAKIYVLNTITKEEIGIRTADWALFKDHLPPNGDLRNVVLAPDGLREFNGPIFKKQIEDALVAGIEAIKGPSWNAWVEALSRRETREFATLITAREHSPDEIMAGLQVLYDRGLIPALPLKENIFPVGWAGFPPELKGKTFAESKANVMMHVLDKIQKVKVPKNATLVENREGDGRQKLHLWGFSDDDYDNFSTALKVLSAEVKAHPERWSNIKIVLFFTGLNNPDQRPHSVVVNNSEKGYRDTLPEEATRSQVLGRLIPEDKARLNFDHLLQSCQQIPAG